VNQTEFDAGKPKTLGAAVALAEKGEKRLV